MHTKITQNIKIIILGLIVAVGAGYVSAAWTPAPAGGPPTCPTSIDGCNAPINTSASAQIKDGTLTLGGLGIVGDFTFLPSVGATVTDGQVLMADGNTGKVKWGTATGGGTGLESMCNSISTTAAFVGYKEIDLTKGSKNMCADDNGCSYRLVSYDSSGNYDGAYGTGDYVVWQTSNNAWGDSSGNQTGINGNTTATAMFGWHGSYIYDDSTQAGGETSATKFTFRDDSASTGYKLTFCDL